MYQSRIEADAEPRVLSWLSPSEQVNSSVCHQMKEWRKKQRTEGLRGWMMIYGWGFWGKLRRCHGNSYDFKSLWHVLEWACSRWFTVNQDVSYGRWIWSTRFIFRCIEWKRDRVSDYRRLEREAEGLSLSAGWNIIKHLSSFYLMFKRLNSAQMLILIL